MATPGWGDLGVAKPTGKQGSLATFSRSFHLYDSFHFWWLYRGTSEGLDGSLSVFPSHRKLDEEYKERIAALKNEFRKEREQILQQVGKQRLELEQEIEKAKTEENYVRDRLALSLKVIILLVMWSVCLLGTPHEKPQLCKRTGLHRAHKSGSTPGHGRAPGFRGVQASGLPTAYLVLTC